MGLAILLKIYCQPFYMAVEALEPRLNITLFVLLQKLVLWKGDKVLDSIFVFFPILHPICRTPTSN